LTATISPLHIRATHPPSLSLTAVSVLCSKTEHCILSQQCSLLPPISISYHPSQSSLMALAKSPLVPRQVGLHSTRILKHLPQRAVSLLAKIFNAVLLTHHFPSVWKHAEVISTLKPWKDLSQPSSYRPISLLDTIGKLFQKILLARILHVLSKRGLMYDEHFGFRPRHGTSL